MTIGIIGSGALGSNVARALAKKGIAATISTRRGPESLAPLVAELGGSIQAGTVTEAASADIVLIALRWTDLDTAPQAGPISCSTSTRALPAVVSFAYATAAGFAPPPSDF